MTKTNVDFQDRARRLDLITKQMSKADNYDLVKTAALNTVSMNRIRTAVNFFLWNCLSQFYKNQAFTICDDMLEAYHEQIINLPNVTPNGLILPKLQNQLAYNLVHQAVAQAFEDLHIDGFINRIQFPLNIRLQSGTSDSAQDSRRRASVKPHSDIWAGDPGSGLMVFLAVLGRTESSGIAFSSPSNFPKSFIRTLDDYSEGHEVVTNARHLCHFEENKWFIVDPFVIHQTTKGGSGYRISIDYRFISTEAADSDFDEDALRAPYFITFPEWKKFGNTDLYVTDELMAPYVNVKNEPYMKGYPVKLRKLCLLEE